MRISINLATRPYADQGPMVKNLRIGMAVCAGLLLILGLGLLHFHQSALRIAAQEEALDASIANIQREQQGYQLQMQQPANARVLNQAGFLNHLFDEKSFSWTATMEELERVLPAGIQVTAIEPVRSKTGVLTLRLRVAGQRERAVEMVRDMEHSRRFIHPRITGENSENSSASGTGALQQTHDSGRVSFEVLAEYNPATLEERKEELSAQRRVRSVEPQPVMPAIRPSYIPPNQRNRPSLRPMAGRVPNGPNGMNPNIPTGFDPNGLRNHDRNRLRPDGSLPVPNSGEPQ